MFSNYLLLLVLSLIFLSYFLLESTISISGKIRAIAINKLAKSLRSKYAYYSPIGFIGT